MSVEAATSFPERFRTGAVLLWRRGEQTRTLTVEGARPHGDRWLLRFREVDGLEAVRDLAGGELVVPEKEAFAPPAGFYYSHRIEGWRCEDGAGRGLGIVTGLEQTVAGPLLTVRTPEGKSVLVPFVASIVVSVDEEEGRIVLDPPAGLFEL